MVRLELKCKLPKNVTEKCCVIRDIIYGKLEY